LGCNRQAQEGKKLAVTSPTRFERRRKGMSVKEKRIIAAVISRLFFFSSAATGYYQDKHVEEV